MGAGEAAVSKENLTFASVAEIDISSPLLTSGPSLCLATGRLLGTGFDVGADQVYKLDTSFIHIMQDLEDFWLIRNGLYRPVWDCVCL